MVHVLVLGGILLVLGAFAMYSVSVFESFGLTLYQTQIGVRDEPTNYYFFFLHLKNILIALGIGGVLAFIPWATIKKLKYVIFLATLVGLLLLFTPLGETFNGQRAWLNLGFSYLQPGEFFKIGFVFFLGSRLLRKRPLMNDLTRWIGFLIISGLCYVAFMLMPDLGAVYVMAPVSLILYRYAGGKKTFIALTIVLGIGAMFLAATQFPHIRVRLDYYLNPDKYANRRDVGWQNRQALLAIGGGGWIGKGYGKGLQKFGYIPEAQSDFIFAALAEEIGVIGIGVVLALYLSLTRVILKKLPKLPNEDDQIYAVGFLSLIVMQAFIVMGVNMGLVPLTGLTLPFFSHGGSALMANVIEIVLLRKILRHNNQA